jgi:hypothetical protein
MRADLSGRGQDNATGKGGQIPAARAGYRWGTPTRAPSAKKISVEHG